VLVNFLSPCLTDTEYSNQMVKGGRPVLEAIPTCCIRLRNNNSSVSRKLNRCLDKEQTKSRPTQQTVLHHSGALYIKCLSITKHSKDIYMNPSQMVLGATRLCRFQVEVYRTSPILAPSDQVLTVARRYHDSKLLKHLFLPGHSPSRKSSRSLCNPVV